MIIGYFVVIYLDETKEEKNEKLFEKKTKNAKTKKKQNSVPEKMTKFNDLRLSGGQLFG